MPGRKEILERKRSEIEEHREYVLNEREKKLREREGTIMDEASGKKLDKEIADLEEEIKIHNGKLDLLREVEDMSNASDKSPIDKRKESNIQEYVNVKKGNLDLKKNIKKGEGSALLESLVDDNIDQSKQSHAAMDAYLESLRTSPVASLSFRVLQVAGIVMAASSLALAVLNFIRSNQPKKVEPPKKDDKSLQGGGGSSGKNDMDSKALGTARVGVSASDAAGGPGEGATPELSADEIEDLMQNLFINKGVIAAGKVSQDTLWQNLAAVAEGIDLNVQNTTLMFIQEAAVDLPGARDFFWLDPDDMAERYDALRQAYKRSGKLSDVYLEATKIEYNEKKVPTFHVALLLQLALRLIKHDLRFAGTETAQGA